MRINVKSIVAPIWVAFFCFLSVEILWGGEDHDVESDKTWTQLSLDRQTYPTVD